MAMETCVDCKNQVQDPPRPEYRVKSSGATIRPAARCDSCRSAYEALRTGQNGGLVKLEEGTL